MTKSTHLLTFTDRNEREKGALGGKNRSEQMCVVFSTEAKVEISSVHRCKLTYKRVLLFSLWSSKIKSINSITHEWFSLAFRPSVKWVSRDQDMICECSTHVRQGRDPTPKGQRPIWTYWLADCVIWRHNVVCYGGENRLGMWGIWQLCKVVF